MNCGARLAEPPGDPPEVGRDRARRMLDGLTRERRRLLPAAFIDALEEQASEPPRSASPEPEPDTHSGRAATVSGSFASADSTGELQLGPAIRTFLGPRRRDHPADVVTQPDFPAILTGPPAEKKPHRLQNPVSPSDPSAPGSAAPPEPAPSAAMVPGLSRLATDPGRVTPGGDASWADSVVDALEVEFGVRAADQPPWEQPFVPPPDRPRSWTEEPPADALSSWSEEPPSQVTDSFDGDLDRTPATADRSLGDEFLSVYDIEVVEQAAPDMPLHRALKTGTGPFGVRSQRFRLVMLPDDGYRGRIHFLQHRLAQTLQLDLFKARQYLQRTIPTFLTAGDDRIEMKGMADHLGAGGVVALLLERDRWLEGNDPFDAVSAVGEGPGPVTFLDPVGQELVVYRADISWGAVGEIRAEGAIDAFTSLDGASISLESRSGRYQLLDLFRYSSRAPIRIRSDRFDFDCLGEDRRLAASVNMRSMVRWLSPEASDPLRPDDSFKRIPFVAGMAARGDLDEEAARIPPREVDFTEYTLLLDAARRQRR